MRSLFQRTDPGTFLPRALSIALLALWGCGSEEPTRPAGTNRIWRVNADGTGDAPTIQAAIDNAVAGDVVLLEPGTYSWNAGAPDRRAMIHLRAGLTLRGEAGAASTTIDAQGFGRAIWCEGASGEIAIEGVTVTRGSVASDFSPGGAAIAAAGSVSLRLADCVFRANSVGFGYSSGGAVDCSRATISRCTFSDNRAPVGGGIRCQALVAEGSIFRGNLARGHAVGIGGAIDADSATVTGCVFESNIAASYGGIRGGAVRIGSGAIVDCRFIGNRASRWDLDTAAGGAVFCESDCRVSRTVFVENEVRGLTWGYGGAIASSGSCLVERCTLVRNRSSSERGEGSPAFRIGGIAIESGAVRSTIVAWSDGLGCSRGARIECSDFFANSAEDSLPGIDGGGNFALDPGFCDPSSDFSLQGDSPCAPGNHPNGETCGLIGALPAGCSVETSAGRRH
jgi:hypothetical protein